MQFISSPEPCQYLPDRDWQFEYDVVPDVTNDDYGARLRSGWRRFGHAMFRPVCAHCTMCRSLRVPIATFAPSRSQRRAWSGNTGLLRLSIGAPAATAETLDLFDRYHRHQHEARGWPQSNTPYDDMFVSNPFPTEEWQYRLDSRLVGVGYVDRVSDGLSLIYFFHEPEEHRRSLGTFNVLTALAQARSAGLSYVYLGYYVEGCRSLEYKARFQPNETLTAQGRWEPFLG